MASIVWLGEGEDGPRFNTWNGRVFKVGEAVEIDDERMIAKARTNRFYSVAGEDPEADKDQDELSGMKVGELRELAEQRGINVEGMKKAEIVDALNKAPEPA